MRATLAGFPARTNIELGGDPRFARRVARLAAVCVVMLGIIWWLGLREGVSQIVSGLLLAGWITMPTLLAGSLIRPSLRVLLIGPSTLVTIGILLAMISAKGGDLLGWGVLLAGILMGDLLGLWLWLRVVPATGAWVEPFSAQRWIAIAVHIALVLSGITIVFIA